MKNFVLSNVSPCGFCTKRRYGGMCRLHHQGGNNQQVRNNVNLSSECASVVSANVVPSSLILFILMIEATHSSITSFLTRSTWRHIRQDGIFHCR
jgi:hypothetical protein